MRYLRLYVILVLLASAGLNSFVGADEFDDGIYVPYDDLVRLITPADKAILMDAARFKELLAVARKAGDPDSLEAGQVVSAEYTGTVSGMNLNLKGVLEVVSLSDEPVAVPLAFARLGLTRVTLDGTAAPLGYDKSGRLTLVLTKKGPHKLDIEGTAKLTELTGGGMQFGVAIPEAVSGTVNLALGGDMEVHASAPVASSNYDKNTDETNVQLIVGGKKNLTVVLLGNGRQDDDRAILLGDSATSVQLTRSHQTMSCLFTIQVLRRGVRQLQFRVPADWTITEVSCPSLVRWSIDQADTPNEQTLAVRLRSAKTGSTALHIKATAPRKDALWQGPRVALVDAAFQRGYLLVGTDEGIGLRGEKLTNARREDVSATTAIPGLMGLSVGQLYFHWQDAWSVELEPTIVDLYRTVKANQTIEVLTDQIRLTGRFEVTAVDREMFDMSFALAGADTRWDIETVQVDDKDTGFEYRIQSQDDRRILRIELASPVMPEKLANVRIILRHVPSDWQWDEKASERTVAAPMIECLARNVSGHISVTAAQDLDLTEPNVPPSLEIIGVGRMASLGMSRDVRYAFSHKEPATGRVELTVSRRDARIAARSTALINARREGLVGTWRITYHISRASAKRLYLLADASLGTELSITSPTVKFASKNIVVPGQDTIDIPDSIAADFNLWALDLDRKTTGPVVVDVQYERPLQEGAFGAGLIRPVCAGDISEQLAIQAGEELAVDITATNAKDIDAVDLDPLPVAAGRILAAYQLQAITADNDGDVTVTLSTKVHDNYRIPPALVLSASLTTHLDVRGHQRTEAAFHVSNAGMQFLTMRLADGAQLWSLRIGDTQAKPQRSADGDYQVAIGRSIQPIPVKVVYAYQPADASLEHLELAGVELIGVETNQLTWNVICPTGYKVVTQHSRMQMQTVGGVRPAYIELFDLLNEWSGGLIVMNTKALSQSSIAHDAMSIEGGEKYRMDLQMEEDAETALAEAKPATAKLNVPPVQKAAGQKAETKKRDSQDARAEVGKRVSAKGRYTLPVNLISSAAAGPTARFTGLGEGELIVGLGKQDRTTAWHSVGFMLILLAGIAVIAQRAIRKVILIAAVLSVSSFVAIWLPTAAHFANGAFNAAIALILIYPAAAILRCLGAKLCLCQPVTTKAAVASLFLISMFILTPSATAATQAPKPAPAGKLSSVVIPYTGDPSAADAADKVLVPYSRFVELWNRAHPDDPIDKPRPGSDISLADAKYTVEITAERVDLVLQADVRTFGSEWVKLAMPFSNLAITQATFDGKPAQLQTAPKAMTLMLPGGASGLLEIKAVTKPNHLGQRGSVGFSLPPLPAAVMNVVLDVPGVELEADGIDGVVTKQTVDNRTGWVVPLSMKRQVTLRWQPKVPDSAADRTLSAVATHDVYAFHWALVGVTKIRYDFSAGTHDKFYLLVPPDVMLTELKGANLRNFRQVGAKDIEGGAFKVMEVNLHRPAKTSYEMTVRWLGTFPALDEPSRLLLVRVDGVGRESGSVTLHAAGGMNVKVADVKGGRRTNLAESSDAPASASDRARAVAKYYWPYRPFALSVELSRPHVSPAVTLDQLVRINRDKVQLIVQTTLAADEGNLFGATYALPPGYELLSVVGASVASYYERTDDEARKLYVKFKSAENRTKMAMVLVTNKFDLAEFDVPLVRYLDDAGVVAGQKSGRIAVQIARSLDARTLTSRNLKSVVPRVLSNWLKSDQVNAVQFAYQYDTDDPALTLGIRPQPGRVRLETFAAMNVRPTAAMYTWRLRYNISGSPVDRLAFTMPTAHAAISVVESPAMRSAAKTEIENDLTRWDVSLINEVTGAIDVTVNFSLPIDESTKSLELPQIRGVDVDETQTIVAVQNISRHEVTVASRNALAEMPYSAQQSLMPANMRSSLQYVFRTFEEDWSLLLAFTPAKPAARIQAVVDLLALTTVIDRKGRCSYEAKVALQNRSEQFLRVKVPEGLRLWSAKVAGQPVKPVTDKNAAADVVLIPLVKTSPGGLPYDVNMYFAGLAVRPLDGITTITPPAVAIADIPVMQTTWSLQLPAGYKYLRPTGNVSAIAGTAEVMSLGIQATLNQLQRLDRTYRDIAGASSRGEQIARYNIDALNKKAEAQMNRYKAYMSRNPDQIRGAEYERLQGKLAEQEKFQSQIIFSNSGYIQQQDEWTRNDVNFYLNQSAPNVGTADAVANKALLDKPAFLGENERGQMKRLQKELEISEKQKRSFVANQAAQQPGQDEQTIVVNGQEAAGLLLHGRQESEEVTAILNSVIAENAAQIDREISQVKFQLENLKDNRAQRLFQKQAAEQQVQTRRPMYRSTPGRRMQPSAGGESISADSSISNRRGGVGGGMGGAVTGPADTAQSYDMDFAAGRELNAPAIQVRNAVLIGAGDAAVAGGTYSLPVTMPTGQVRLDFARPAGDAQLSIIAVPTRLIDNIKRTVLVAVISLIIAAAIKFWPRSLTLGKLKPGYALLYAAVIVILAIMAGLVGIIIAAAFILICQITRSVIAGRTATT